MNFDVKGFDELMSAMSAIDAEKIVPKVLQGCAPIVKKAIQKRASNHRDTGDLINSVKETKVMKNDMGFFTTVRPTGRDRKGVRNMEKLAALEYGVDGKQAATPIIPGAIRDSEEEVLNKMQEIFDSEVEI